MSAKRVAIAAILVFVAAVVGLSVFGHDYLNNMSAADATVDYLDLARQASDQRNYAKADDLYKQALSFAEARDDQGPLLQAVLLSYAEYLRDKRKDKERAANLEARARIAVKAHALHNSAH